MKHVRHAALAAAIASALSALSAPALADSATEAQLRKMIELQAQQIAQQQQQLSAMNARLSALEGGKPGAAVAGTSADPTQAQVAAAVADTRSDDELAILKAQVAQMAVAGGGAKSDGNVSWSDGGPEFKSADGRFTFHPRGRVLMDFTSTHGSRFDARNVTGTDMASGRLGAEGEAGPLGYKIEADFAGNEVSMKDVYLSWDTKLGGLPAEVYVGSKLKDRSIDGATGGTTTPFMERNAVGSVGGMQSGFFGLGVTTKLYGSNWHASLAVTGDDIGGDSSASDTIAYTARAHWNPIKTSAGFLHVGGWYWYEDLGKDITSINKTSRVALGWNGQVAISASSIGGVTDDHAWGAELGGTWRSGWAFAETTVRTINSSTEASREQKASSYYAGWLLTGEKPGFSSRSGVWTTTKVLRPVTEGGWGAFEVLARYDDYDFTDAARGGEGEAFTFGVNWYLTSFARLMLNVVHWRTDNKVGSYQGPDSGNTVGVRAQVSF
ncbi:OprO/OprP family phosphate-selective porin [Pseudoxanthomonas winnipegensis]|uniref:OprO/OprP family phosphate-selective porin n=1 Tax=Pseudoxanthomonas winnipegensis TaxID=2480810 RepID=UPI00103EF77C|nr:porin [Pseudoxanthomonas winnipegensis]TBV73907.1 porin [Pseudoxanthomonas winnipegensis]